MLTFNQFLTLNEQSTKKVFIEHLDKMKPLKFIELVYRLNKEFGGKLSKEKINITEKIDGSACRVGQDEHGRPFMETSTSPSTFEVGEFAARAKAKGYTDILSKKFDNLLNIFKMHRGLQGVISKYNKKDKRGIKIIGEILYPPLGIDEVDKIKFIRISYDKIKLGRVFTFVPFKVIYFDNGEQHPAEDAIKKELYALSNEDYKFIKPELKIDSDIDITIELSEFDKNILAKYGDDLETVLTSRKKIDKELKEKITEEIKQYQSLLAQKILQYVKSGVLGKEYEGIVIEFSDGSIVKIVSDVFKGNSFKKLSEEHTIILEGGNAVPGVSPINQENAEATLRDIYKQYLPLLKIKESDVASLGSTGKKGPGQKSGDIDLAISAPALLKNNSINSFGDIVDLIVACAKRLRHDYRDMRGIGIVSVAFPITNADGKQPNEKVQLDFMIVDSVKYASWAYFSPSYLQSELKGLYRNQLTFAVAKYAGFKATKIDTSDNKTPIEWQRYWFSMNKGLEHGLQTQISSTGKKLKNARVIAKSQISMDPDEIVKMLYGDHLTANQILTFEDALKAVLSPKFPHRQHVSKILKMASDGIQSTGYPVPESLARVL